MAHLRMGDVVYQNEFGIPRIGTRSGGLADARTHLASQMFTDAVFNQDIRVIQTIINRIDGGLPKDIEVDEFETLFGDCINEVLSLTDGEQLRVDPDDSVMMALSKSLYSIATDDIYHEYKDGKARRKNPSTEAKAARDSALRLVLERSGGRKTAIPKQTGPGPDVKVASWIRGALPQTGEEDEGTR